MIPAIKDATETVHSGVLYQVNSELNKRVLYLSLKNVAAKLDCSTSSVKKWVKLNGFPQPVRMFDNDPRWIEAEVDAWVDSKNPQRGNLRKFQSKLDQDAAAIIASL